VPYHKLIICVPAMLQAGIVLATSVCLVCKKSQKLLGGNGCNLVGVCLMVNARSGLKLVTFDLDSYFHFLLNHAMPFKWLYLATSLSVRRYTFRISRPWYGTKVMGPKSRSRQQKSGSIQLKAASNA